MIIQIKKNNINHNFQEIIYLHREDKWEKLKEDQCLKNQLIIIIIIVIHLLLRQHQIKLQHQLTP